jgi:hypothetical protein
MRFDDFKLVPNIIAEASNLSATELNAYPERVARFLQKIKTRSPFVTTDGQSVTIAPSEFKRLNALSKQGGFAGKINLLTTDGNTITSGKLAKTGEFGGQSRTPGATGEEAVKINMGEIAEGYHAAAAFARLIKRPSTPVTVADVLAVVAKLKNGATYKITAKEIGGSDIADEFHITVSLKPGSWESFKDPLVADKMAKMLAVIAHDANMETSKYADVYQENNRFDYVRVIGDGVSGENETKTDITFANETEMKFAEYSLKVGTTKQIHQVGGGKLSLPMGERFDILQNGLFNVDGRFPLADISGIKSTFIKQKDLIKAQAIAYKAATDSMNKRLQGKKQEKQYMQNLISALKYWMVRDNENIKLKQFTQKYTYILDAKKFNELESKGLDLIAVYEGGKGKPEMAIMDRNSGKRLITIRTYQNAKGYVRNYVEKEALFVELTKVVD